MTAKDRRNHSAISRLPALPNSDANGGRFCIGHGPNLLQPSTDVAVLLSCVSVCVGVCTQRSFGRRTDRETIPVPSKFVPETRKHFAFVGALICACDVMCCWCMCIFTCTCCCALRRFFNLYDMLKEGRWGGAHEGTRCSTKKKRSHSIAEGSAGLVARCGCSLKKKRWWHRHKVQPEKKRIQSIA